MREKFALLVPCYNGEKYVNNFHANIKNLSIPFDEILFFDDGSQDQTYQALQSIGYKVIREEMNRGPAYARNRLISESNAEWIHFHDIDDEMHPDFLLEMSKAATEGNYDVIICNADWIEPNTRRSIIQWKYSNEAIQQNPLCYTIEKPIGGINGLYRRSILNKIEGFDESLPIWEDADLHVRLANNSARFKVIEKFLVFSNRYPNSQSTDSQKIDANRAKVLNKYINILGGECKAVLQKEVSKLYQKSIISRNRPLSRLLLSMCGELNFKPPYTKNTFIKFLKAFVPSEWIVYFKLLFLRLQQFSSKIMLTHIGAKNI